MATLNEKLSLAGKRALVCGASQGIGRAAARSLAAQGASVVVLARSGEKLEETVAELPRSNHQDHSSLVADLAATAALPQALASLDLSSPVHILVNNSGGPAPGLVTQASVDAFRDAFAQHVLAAQILATLLLPGMRTAGHGRIINVISTSVKEPIAGLGVSNTIRGAMASWAKTMASEVGPDGITVNNVLPGYTRTGRLQPIFAARAEKAGVPEAEVEEQARNSVPLRRFAEPSEVGDVIAFLASDAAAYINGINLPVDGGRTGSL